MLNANHPLALLSGRALWSTCRVACDELRIHEVVPSGESMRRASRRSWRSTSPNSYSITAFNTPIVYFTFVV